MNCLCLWILLYLMKIENEIKIFEHRDFAIMMRDGTVTRLDCEESLSQYEMVVELLTLYKLGYELYG